MKEHCDALELQLRRLRQLVAQKEVPLARPVTHQHPPPQQTRVLPRLESTPLLPNQPRKNDELEQLNFSPIDEPHSLVQRSTRERQSLRNFGPKSSNIVTNGTLTYCTPRLSRKGEGSSGGSSVSSIPRFTTEFSLRDLSRKLHPAPSTESPSSSIGDSQLNAELEEILAQLDQLFPSQQTSEAPSGVLPQENATLVRATHQVAGVLAEFVDGFNEN